VDATTHDVLLLLAFIIWKVRESRRQQATVRRDPAAAVFFSLHLRAFFYLSGQA
jgi:hypothetical protein